MKARQRVGQADAEQLGLQVVQRDVDGRHRHRSDPGLAELPGLHLHGREGLLGHQRIGGLDRVGEL